MTDMTPHARSAGVRNPYLNMFKIPPTDLSMSSRRFVRINPFNVGINPVTFQVDPQEDFIDLKESYFEVELTVKKDNATNLAAADVMAPVNNLAHALFKQINVRLNGTLISPQTDTYHLKAFLETILNHDRDDGKTILTPEGWYNEVKSIPMKRWNSSMMVLAKIREVISGSCKPRAVYVEEKVTWF